MQLKLHNTFQHLIFVRFKKLGYSESDCWSLLEIHMEMVNFDELEELDFE